MEKTIPSSNKKKEVAAAGGRGGEARHGLTSGPKKRSYPMAHCHGSFVRRWLPLKSLKELTGSLS